MIIHDDDSGVFTEMRGNRRCLIEGMERLLEYGDDVITVETKRIDISIRGSELTLDCLAENRIGVRGKIDSVLFTERNAI